ncbi:MAG: signal transduction histidine kinase [Oligoflexia bacterium]|nr:MAG: signal transduction histidine kinase [Oligoflexia bacterium]
MSSVSSNVLLIGDFLPATSHLEVESIARLDEIKQFGQIKNFDVIIVPFLISLSQDFQNLVEEVQLQNPGLQIVLITTPSSSAPDVLQVVNELPIFRIVGSVRDLNFEQYVLESIEESQRIKQQAALEVLVQSLNDQLTALSLSLEDRVQKRQAYLEEAKKKTLIANSRWEAIQKVSLAIYKASSLSEIESNLSSSLKESVLFDSVRIRLPHQAETTLLSEQNRNPQIYTYSIELSQSENQNKIGDLVFVRTEKKSFSKDETDFLNKISEVVSLAVDRILKLNESETLKDQWEATFNAVSDPVCLITQNYEVIQANLAFSQKSNLLPQQLIRQKCYQVLFHRNAPCSHCQLGHRFRLDTGKSHNQLYEVYSQSLQLDPQSEPLFVHQYHDITEQTKMQRQILESARLAEIGTIGGSIAHELNNPLGGILSFIQLIQMDLKSDDPIFPDIKEMEKGVRRCQEIVQNLLGFVRNPTADEYKEFDIREAIERAIKIVELQTKSMGIEIKVQFPNKPALITGYLNVISHAFQNLLQNSIERIIEQIRTQTPLHGIIEIKVVELSQDIEITIIDNGPAHDLHRGLGVAIARQIIHDLHGRLEISAQFKNICMAKISLPRLVFKAEGPN